MSACCGGRPYAGDRPRLISVTTGLTLIVHPALFGKFSICVCWCSI